MINEWMQVKYAFKLQWPLNVYRHLTYVFTEIIFKVYMYFKIYIFYLTHSTINNYLMHNLKTLLLNNPFNAFWKKKCKYRFENLNKFYYCINYIKS